MKRVKRNRFRAARFNRDIFVSVSKRRKRVVRLMKQWRRSSSKQYSISLVLFFFILSILALYFLFLFRQFCVSANCLQSTFQLSSTWRSRESIVWSSRWLDFRSDWRNHKRRLLIWQRSFDKWKKKISSSDEQRSENVVEKKTKNENKNEKKKKKNDKKFEWNEIQEKKMSNDWISFSNFSSSSSDSDVEK